MATELATAYVSLVPSFRGIQGEVARGLAPVAGAADKAGRDSGKRFGGGMKLGVGKVAGLLGGAFAAVKVKDFLGDAISEARESQKVGALTTSIIKSTGGAANVTAKQVGNLAGAISAKVGVDDEVIQSGANMLLTFKNVRNEVGKGNKIFDEATKAAVDLSAAGFGDVAGQSKMLGKALNDPIKGISALGRSGVTFSEKQKTLIKGFVEQGDMLSAQKIILGEVKSQVGGAAEASATAGEKLAVSWGNFKETIGTALLPLIDKLATFISGRLLPGLLAMGPTISKVVGFIKSLFGQFSGSSGQASTQFQQFKTTVMSVWASVKSIFTSGIAIVRSLWAMFGSNIKSSWGATFTNILTITRGVFTLLQGVFQTWSALLKGDWSGVWEGIKKIYSGAWKIVMGLVKQGWNLIVTAFKTAGIIIKSVFGGIWNGLKNLAAAGIGKVVDAIKAVPGKIRALGGKFADAGKSVIGKLIEGLGKAGSFAGDFAQKIWSAVKSAINKGIDRLNSLLEFKVAVPGAPDIHINPPNIGHLAKGTRSWRGGPTWIGERGPEIVNLPRGSSVMSNKDSMAAVSASATPTIVQHIYPRAGQSEKQIGDAAASRVLWAMSG